MKAPISRDHPLYLMFRELVQTNIQRHVESRDAEEVERYLTELLLEFLHTDAIFAIRDRTGQPIVSVIEMIGEGDVRLRADSFEREREVHKHVGDYILFWSGIYPDFLRHIKVASICDIACDYTRVGQESYRVVSSFAHGAFADEAPMFRKLSDGFADYSFVLGRVGREANLHIA